MFPENREGRADEVRRSLHIGSYEMDEQWEQQGRFTNTNSLNTPVPYKLHNVTVDYGHDNNSYNNKIITNKKKEIQKARTSTGEKK
jgi:hypothetical protein